ncbi:hypothetical protein [Marinobacter sp. V034]|uniref:hypothetical protein n=1 Tax=Marinobacter sp. V034 TaxID=3459610 RepID=UPI0040450653
MDYLGGEIVVTEIAGKAARVKTGNLDFEISLLALGFQKEGNDFVCSIENSNEREYFVRELITLNALFSAGRDWSPSELVGYLKETDAVSGKYREISRSSLSEYRIEFR